MTVSSLPLATQWAGDAAWLAMDTSARGFHAQLMLFAAQREPAGTLPDDDALWRRLAGVPEAGVEEEKGTHDKGMAALMKTSLATGQKMGVPEALVLALHPQARAWRDGQGNWLDHLWQTRWKPMLLNAWPTVTAATIIRHPTLAGQEGLRYCELAMRLGPAVADVSNDTMTTHAGEPATAAVKATATPKRKRSKKEQDPVILELLAITPHTDPLQDPAYVLGCFRALPLTIQRSGIWDLGLRVLANSPEKEGTKRSYLAKLIKDYGETAVAAALGEVLVKPIAPAEVKSFLQGVLRVKRDGSKAVQAAQQQRARVLL